MNRRVRRFVNLIIKQCGEENLIKCLKNTFGGISYNYIDIKTPIFVDFKQISSGNIFTKEFKNWNSCHAWHKTHWNEVVILGENQANEARRVF